MTKFPEGDTAEDARLQNVIDTVKEQLQCRGFTARIADGHNVHHRIGYCRILDWVFAVVRLFIFIIVIRLYLCFKALSLC